LRAGSARLAFLVSGLPKASRRLSEFDADIYAYCRRGHRMTGLDTFVGTYADELVAELVQWCAIPSISTDPQYAVDVRRSAEFLAERLAAAGLDAEPVAVPGAQPAVWAQWLGAGPQAPTVTIYGHHDVQPVDPLSAWETPPFQPAVRDGWLYARGASDDKGQVHFQLAAVRHLLASQGRLPVNVRFLIEGEEEAGSPNIEAFLAAHADRFACDVIVVSDTGMYAEGVPSLVTGMRGLAYLQVDLRTAEVDLHSGSFGGAVPNAAAALVELLGRLRDDSGRIAIPGFYDDVVPLSAAEREQFAALPFDQAQFAVAAGGVRALPGEAGYTPLERVWARPSVDVNGLWSGYSGAGSKTIIPAEAHAKVSFRLVADQDPARVARLFERWAVDNAPAGAEVSVTSMGGTRAALTPLDHPANLAAGRAIERAFGKAPLFTREGGSGPERALSDALGAPCVYVGAMLPEDRVHAPNERFKLSQYFAGLRAAVYTLEELGEPRVAAALGR
jgi:acetylornithine deacetylase/succinyl-diaminopimelate desuccinylase-like protein